MGVSTGWVGVVLKSAFLVRLALISQRALVPCWAPRLLRYSVEVPLHPCRPHGEAMGQSSSHPLLSLPASSGEGGLCSAQAPSAGGLCRFTLGFFTSSHDC